jgi:hypothetical protein
MADDKNITLNQGEDQKGQLGGGRLLCEECGELEAQPGKKICRPCEAGHRRAEEEEAAKREIIEEKTYPEELLSLLDIATSGFKSFYKLLDTSEEYDEVSQVLKPLLERQWADLEKIEAVISGSLGHVKVLVCTDPMRVDGKSYGVGDFYQALLEPKEARG